jgi:hypothetical protein
MKFKFYLVVFACIFLTAARSVAQTEADTSQDVSSWSGLGISINGNIIPKSPFTVTPVATLLLNHFSAELRYNYEDVKTISGAIGYNFYHDRDFWFVITPKAAVAVGHFDGISPALSVILGTGKFAFSADAEYAYSFDSSNASYFFSWFGATMDIGSAFYLGINAQHTKLYNTPNGLDAGIVFGFNPGNFDVHAEAANFWNDNRYFVIGAGYFFDWGKKKRNISSIYLNRTGRTPQE